MTAKLKYLDPEIYIFNAAGCHGHYLQYLIDCLSKKTPTITELPFNELGNSHNKINYSGLCKFVEATEHNEYKNLKNSKIIRIRYENEILYYERVAMNRANDANRDLKNIHNDISFLKTYNIEFYEKIKNIYNLQMDSVPKFILRDAYKMGFLDWNNQGSVVKSNKEKKWIHDHLSQNNDVYFLQVEIFFNIKNLINELKIIDKKFNLELDLDLNKISNIHAEFLKRNKIIQTHSYTNLILDAIDKFKNIDIPNLDILQEAYIYAKLEEKNDFIIMPMVENFFNTTQQIIDYIKFYPQYYKAMNPNLPTFNNIPNPFFLHRQKTK